MERVSPATSQVFRLWGLHGSGVHTNFIHVHTTHRPLSSSFLGLPCRSLNRNHKKELLRGLWVASGNSPERAAPVTTPSDQSVYGVYCSAQRPECGDQSASSTCVTKMQRQHP